MSYHVAPDGPALDTVARDRVALDGAATDLPRAADAASPAARLSTVCRALHDAMSHDAAAPRSGYVVGLLAQLRAGVTRYVCGLRADGARPEQMLVRVKALLRDAMAAAGWYDPEATRALTADVVGWSIAAYYDR